MVRKVNWTKSKKLLPGCLVMLTSDCCETALFATTLAPPYDQVSSSEGVDSRRKELSYGILRLAIESGASHVEKNLNYIMFECEAYFEACRYNLAILQKTRILNTASPMSKFIVEASSSVQVPLYARGLRWDVGREAHVQPRLQLHFPHPIFGPLGEDEQEFWGFGQGLLVPLDQGEGRWPNSLIKTQLGLDENQYNANKTALTSELSVIQGPPGAGKTFIGLQIVKTLLLNSKKKRFDGAVPNSPILILCYTNHALDQFLELLLKEIKGLDLIRVGGQSKSESLKRHSLHEKRRFKVGMNRKYEKIVYCQIKTLEEKLESLKYRIKNLEKPVGIFDFRNTRLGRAALDNFPDSMRNAFCSGDYFGVPGDIRKSIQPSLKEMILKCIEKTGRKLGQEDDDDAENRVSANEEKTVRKGYDEDYNMDELLEHRLEDAYYENFMPKTNQISYGIDYYYLSNCSSIGCRNQARNIDKLIARDTHPSPQRHQELQLDKEENLNRAKILSAIFDLREYGQLPLPNVESLLTSKKGLRSFRRPKMIEVFSARHSQLVLYDSDDDYNDGYGYGHARNYAMEDESDEEYKKVVEEFTLAQPSRSVNTFRMDERWALYFKVVEVALELCREEMENVEDALDYYRHELKAERHYLDGKLLRESDVIGMTTTGAAKNHSLLETASPEIVIIEEAAEILEAHIVTSLTEDCKQLILIGDHLQLRPTPNVYELEQKYHMNVSLFERMILNDINLCTLKTQHRMCPEVADLIVGPIYEQLDNHPKVLQYPHVKGVSKNLFFLTHSQLEDTDAELLSKSNYYEADFISGLCEYLLLQGYKPSQITILTTYTGQMFLLKKVISTACAGVRITSVDNYQGEENDIILLSLVRSNKEDKIGFVGIDNRICVALSRAKHGMYIIGNLESLMRISKTWKQIGAKLEAGGNCGESLELSCSQHGNKTRVSKRAHFAPLKLGGCGLKCGKVLDCAHRCPLQCHGEDHLQYPCSQRCEKICPSLHQCLAKCGQFCPPCQTPVMKMLACGHELEVCCYVDPLTYPCPVIVTKELNCELQHKKDLACHVDISTIECIAPVEKRLVRCGHIQTVQCQEPINHVVCFFEIDHIFLPCNHTRRIHCCEKSKASCVDNCGKHLDCGHECTLICHVDDDPNHTRYVCRQECTRNCIFGHPCSTKHRCYGRCPPCVTLTMKMLECGHEQLVNCGMKPEDYKCKAKCEKLCGSAHPCGVEHACHEKCPPCQTPVVKSLSCHPDHKATLPCHEDGNAYECREKTEKELECGHKAKENCYVNPEDIFCNELVLKKYPDCGHERYVVCFLQQFMFCQMESCRREA